jgi:energy-coupling factor transporter ATP-binding protein EcfA2
MSRHTHYAVLDLVARNKRILLTGPKGAGKSHLVGLIQAEFPDSTSFYFEQGRRRYMLFEDFQYTYTPGAQKSIMKDMLSSQIGYLMVREPDEQLLQNIPFDYIVGVEPLGNQGACQYTIIEAKDVFGDE